MVEITQADQDIASDYNKRFPEIRLTEAFATHRIESTADLQTKLDKAVEALAPFADCMKYIGDNYEDDECPNDWSPFIQVKHYKNAEAAINGYTNGKMVKITDENSDLDWTPIDDQIFKAEGVQWHIVTRQSDEYACSCGKRWDVEDGVEHP